MIRDACNHVCPDISDLISHDSDISASTWQLGIETGKAVEFLTFCSLINAFRSSDAEVKFSDLFAKNPDLFYVRNAIPRHHGAQAGHDSTLFAEIPLIQKFVAALTPKAEVKTSNNRNFMIFREGHPFHFINNYAKGGPDYLDRPDFVISEGEMSLDYPNPTELSFTYIFPSGKFRGALRVKNDIKVPLISFESSGSNLIPINGIIECSVGKGRERAEEQLVRYSEIFSSEINPISALVNGRRKSCPEYDYEALIDLKNGTVEELPRIISLEVKKLVQQLAHKG